MSIKNRFIAGLLTLAMVLGMIPAIGLPIAEITNIEAASLSPDLPNVTVVSTRDTYTDTDEKRRAVQEEIGVSGLVSAAQDVPAHFSVEAWHYGGGYWGGNLPRLVYDSEFKRTKGGVANLEDTLSLGNHTFVYNVPKDSELYKNIEAGEEIVINIGLADTQKDYGIYLDNLFEVEAQPDANGDFSYVKDSQGNIQGMSATIKKAKDGGYQILIDLPLKLNYWPEDTLGFNETYGLNLDKFIPLPKNGYGHVLFSMWDYNQHIGAAQMWFDEENPWSLEGMPGGTIHPTMIRPYRKPDVWGNNPGGTNGGGLLYEKIPLYKSGKAENLEGKQTYSYARNNLQETEWVKKLDRYGNPVLDSNGNPVMEEVQKYTTRSVGISVQNTFYMTVDGKKTNVNGSYQPFPSTRWNIGQGTFTIAGAVGIRFNYDIVLDIYIKPTQKVIASFVKLVDVDEDGNPIYETAMESQYMHVDVKDSIAYIEDRVAVVAKDGETFAGILNDVVTSKKDLGNPQEIKWSEGFTPSTSKDSIATNAKEIDYYRFNIVTDMAKQVLSKELGIGDDYEYLTSEEKAELDRAIIGMEMAAILAETALLKGNMGVFTHAMQRLATFQGTYSQLRATNEHRREEAQKLMGISQGNLSGESTLEMLADISGGTSIGTIASDLREQGVGVVNYEFTDPNGYVNTVIPSEVEEETRSMSNSDNFFTDEVVAKVDYAVELSNPTNVPIKTLDTVEVTVGYIGSDTIIEEDLSSLPTDFEDFPFNSENVSDNYTVENKRANNSEESQYIPVEGLSGARDGLFIEDNQGTITDNNYIYGDDSGNTIYLRYIVFPESIQRNRIHVVDENDVEQYVFIIDIADLYQENDTGVTADLHFVDITPDLETIGEVIFNEWITSSEKVPDLVTQPIPSTGSQSGTSIPLVIPGVPKTEDIYADWTVKLMPPTGLIPVKDSVPQWRLSKYNPQFDVWGKALMALPLKSDQTTHVDTYLIPSGNYNYVPVNANEKDADDSNTPLNQKLYPWLHTKTLTRGGYTISHDKPFVSVDVNATMNMIKATEDSKHVAAKWVPGNDVSTLSQYDIVNGNLPQLYNGPDTYNHRDEIDAGIRNLDVYTHGQTIYYHYSCGGENCGGHCGCYVSPETPSPQYSDAIYPVNIDFDRYKQKPDGDLLTIEPKIEERNGLTTIQYQLNPTEDGDAALNIYPEHGMLFANDAGEESLKWVIGDQVRKIKPVVWQTLEHKVWVKPTSSGTSVATDTRGIAQARAIGEANKQIIYKGAGVNTNFRLYRDKESSNLAIMTVKTYALDFKTGDTYAQFNGPNSAWKNDYNSYDEHATMVKNIETKKTATATEQLLVDIGTYGGTETEYEGAVKSQPTQSYNALKYTNSSSIKVVDGSDNKAVVFEHKLIVRGGALIGVEKDNRNGSKSVVLMENLKDEDEALYNALIGMKLYSESGNRNDTLFSEFEHAAGHNLSQEDAVFANLLNQGRFELDKITTPTTSAVQVGKGWYSEDTTVLVVREYVSNFEVPSISISDKLSMTVGPTPGGLTTPTNKNDFFSVLGKGYLYLKYNFEIESPYTPGNVPKSDAYFVYTSFPTDLKDTKEFAEGGNNALLEPVKFGVQETNYLVPNVSITDTTRLN